jgi:hypothetical protein
MTHTAFALQVKISDTCGGNCYQKRAKEISMARHEIHQATRKKKARMLDGNHEK